VAKAEKILDVRNAFDDGSFLIIKVWRVVDPVPPSPHEFKYSFFYGRPGERLVLFDNERGKGITNILARSRAAMSSKALRS
jgi:hypothetical protein